MTRDEVMEAVLAVIGTLAPEADQHAIRPDRPLREQVDLDSMDWLNVVAAVQDRVAVAIPEDDYGQLATLDAIVDTLMSRHATAARGPRPPSARPPGTLPFARHVIGGVAVTLRPMRAEDRTLEARFVRQLSPEARYQRFMVTTNELSDAKLRGLTEVDQLRHVALVATARRDGQEVLAGVARYIVDSTGTGCEFAITVDDAWQGRGLAGILMRALMEVARARGLATMEGFVLASNLRMMRFAHRLGFVSRPDPDDRETVRVVRTL